MTNPPRGPRQDSRRYLHQLTGLTPTSRTMNLSRSSYPSSSPGHRVGCARNAKRGLGVAQVQRGRVSSQSTEPTIAPAAGAQLATDSSPGSEIEAQRAQFERRLEIALAIAAFVGLALAFLGINLEGWTNPPGINPAIALLVVAIAAGSGVMVVLTWQAAHRTARLIRSRRGRQRNGAF